MGKLLKRVKKGFSKEDVGYLRHCESAGKVSTLHFIIYHCLFAALVTHTSLIDIQLSICFVTFFSRNL